MTTTLSPTIREILDTIQKDFIAHADPAVIEKYRKYFREGYNPYGIDADTFKHLVEIYWKKSNERLQRSELMLLIGALFHGEHYEDQSVAIYILERMKSEYTPETFDLIFGWFDCLMNWAHTDHISHTVLAPFLDNGIIQLHDFDRWLTSPHKWTRRAVPVTLLYVNDLADRLPDYLMMVRPLMTDPEEMVHKGVGWFLREAWKKRPDLVEEYLFEWKDISPRLIFQYAMEKMSKEERQRFKRSK